MKYFAKIKYLGTDFHGFQVQPGLRTVQGELCCALRSAFGQECRVTGCSRTDAGVHANEFCLTVECDGGTIPADKLPVAVARYLPNDLSLFYAEPCDESFHPRYDVKAKEYVYLIKNARIYDPFMFGRVWFFPRPITDSAIDKMNIASSHFLGKHDFCGFMSEGADNTEDTVRNIYSMSVEKKEDLITITVRGDGFLYNMVRIIAGTLIDVAMWKISPDELPAIISSRDRSRAGMTAPAEGLYLNKVIY